MSYVVLARKWRPQTFSEVLGQAHVTVTLENAIRNDRLASAYLFSGPRGVGKTTTARILAKALNCDDGPTPTPCNSCSACGEITRGNSIDVLEIDGASNRGIDEIRNLRESTRYTPAKYRYKVYIVDEVHMLTTEAFNALLKTLEEPPAHVVFIFATTESNKVPPTIMSRCQRFDFKRISIQDIVKQLEIICEKDAIQIDKNILHLLAKKADGSMRDSESLLDQVVSFCGTEVSEEDAARLLGYVGQDLFVSIAEAILQTDLEKIIAICSETYEQGTDATSLLQGLAEFYNNVLKLKVTGTASHLLGLEAYHAAYENIAKQITETDLIRIVQVLSEAIAKVKRSANAQLLLESTLIRLAKLRPAVDIHTLLAGLGELKKKRVAEHEAPPSRTTLQLIPEINPEKVSGSLFSRLNAGAAVSPEESPGRTDTPPAVSDEEKTLCLDDVKAIWPQLIAKVKAEKISLGSFLEEGRPVRLSGNAVDVVFKRTNGFHLDSINANRQLIQNIIRALTGKRVVLNCLLSDAAFEEKLAETKEKEMAVAEPPKPARKATKSLEDFPLARRLVERLGGELIA